MEQTFLELLKAELATKSEEEKKNMFLEETLKYLNVTMDADASCFTALLLYLVVQEKQNNLIGRIESMHAVACNKMVDRLMKDILRVREAYLSNNDFQKDILLIEKNLCLILESFDPEYLEKEYHLLYLEILSLTEDYHCYGDNEAIMPIPLDKRCVLAGVMIRLLKPEGCVFNPRAESGWLSACLPNCCTYIGSNSSAELTLLEKLFLINNKRISRFYPSNYPYSVEFDHLIWIPDYGHKYRMGGSRIKDTIRYDYQMVFNHYIKIMPEYGRAACIVPERFWNYKIRNEKYKKMLFDNDWVEKIIFLDNQMTIVILNKKKEHKGLVEVYDRVLDDSSDALELLNSIKGKKKLFVLNNREIIENGYKVNIMDIVRKVRIPVASKGMKVVQLRDLLTLSVVQGNSEDIISLFFEPQADYSPFKVRPFFYSGNNPGKKMLDYLVADVCNLSCYQPRLFRMNAGTVPFTVNGEIFLIKSDVVDVSYLVNELCKEYFVEQLFPYGDNNYSDDPYMLADVFLSLYILVPDCETTLERQKILYNQEKLVYLKSVNQSYGYDVDGVESNKATYLPAGTMLYNGKYRINEGIGKGGFGRTYRATGYFKSESKTIKSEVAVKEFFMSKIQKRDVKTLEVITPWEKADEVALSRKKFMTEAEKIKRFTDHPHIVNVYDVFDENGTCYYTMEYIEGGSLEDYVETMESGTLEESEAVRIIREVASALSEMHKHRMNHLDVKPKNIMMDEDGKAILIDFGAAHLYHEDVEKDSTILAISSDEYTPIEVGRIRDFSPATDIYSLGVTLYRLLVGQPIGREGLSEDTIKPDEISDKTWNAIRNAVQVFKDYRPQSIEEFLALLD